MAQAILKDKRGSVRIPIELTVLGSVGGGSISMCTENISMDGMFLYSREFVAPQTTFLARVWISNNEEPLQMYFNCCFTERTWQGYGIGVHIAGISATDSIIWDAFYRAHIAATSAAMRSSMRSLQSNRCIVVVEGAVSASGLAALTLQGYEVITVPSVRVAVDVVYRRPVDAVICDLRRSGQDGLGLCSQIHSRRLPTRTVLVTDSTSQRDFSLALYAGATRVIAKTCSSDVLVARVREVVKQCLPPGRIAPSGWDNEEVTEDYQILSETEAESCYSVLEFTAADSRN